MARERIVDVSELEAPRPMSVALEHLRNLDPDEFVVLRHRREPYPLYAMLPELGFAFVVRKGSETAVEVVIWRSDGDPPEGTE